MMEFNWRHAFHLQTLHLQSYVIIVNAHLSIEHGIANMKELSSIKKFSPVLLMEVWISNNIS